MNILIYTLEHPNTHEIRYVGKTNKSLVKRLNQHIDSARHNRSHSKVTKWIRKLLKENKRPVIKLLLTCSLDNWEETEILCIKQFRNKNSRLLNIVDGGNVGFMGGRMPEKAKQAIGIANSRPKSRQWIKNAANAMIKSVSKPIIQYDLDKKFIKRWKSFCFAAKKIRPENYKSAIKNIHACCNNKRKSAYGFIWKYENIELWDKQPSR